MTEHKYETQKKNAMIEQCDEKNEKIKKKWNGFIQPEKRGTIRTFHKLVNKEMQSIITKSGFQGFEKNGPHENNKRKLETLDVIENKKGKVAFSGTKEAYEIKKIGIENNDNKQNFEGNDENPIKKKIFKEKIERDNEEKIQPDKEKNIYAEKNKNKELTKKINDTVIITNLKINEKHIGEAVKKKNIKVSIINGLKEKNTQEKEISLNNDCEYTKFEEQEKYQKALKYNNVDHKYTRNHFVSFSNKYKDGSIRLSDDQLTCYGDKGWASVFLNCGADDGKWYFEITVENSVMDLNFLGYTEKKFRINSCLRVGYACRYMRYDHPIGTNKYSYCVDSKNGKMFNSSISYDCMNSFSKGDVIGCYMNLKKKTNYNFDPRLDKKLYEYIQNGILCDPQNPPELTRSEGSLIFFALNGEIKKNAFVDIYDGFYHPSVSLYMGASARINLGPNFKYNYLKDYVPCMYMHQPAVS